MTKPETKPDLAPGPAPCKPAPCKPAPCKPARCKPAASSLILLFEGLEAADRRLALPVERLIEVAEVPSVITPLPQSSTMMTGIASINGRLVPVLSSTVQLYGRAGERRSAGDRRRVRPQPSDTGDEEGAVLILVQDATGGTLGLLARQLGGVRDLSSAISHKVLVPQQQARRAEDAYAARVEFDDGPVWLLDPDRLFRQPASVGLPTAPVSGTGPDSGNEERFVDAGDDVTTAGEAVLLVLAGGAGHTLPLDDLLLVDSITAVTPLPHTPAAFLGIGLVRDVPLPVVRLFDGTARPADSNAEAEQLVVVIAHLAGPVAVPIDGVIGLSRSVDPVSAIDHLDQAVPNLARWCPKDGEGAEERLRGARAKAPSPHRLLPVEVDGRTYGLALDRVHRILPVPVLTPLPFDRLTEYGHAFQGLAEMEGSLLPVIDLGRNLGTTTIRRRSIDDDDEDEIERRFAVVTETNGGRVALLVDGISRPKRIDPQLWTSMPGPLVVAMALVEDTPVYALGALLGGVDP